MSTASSRLADIVRRKRGVMQMPEMDLTKPEMNPDLTEADINAVGEKPVVLPEMDLTAGAALDPSGQQSWPTNDPNADPDKVTPSEPVVTRGAVRADEPSAVATQVTPLEPTINAVVSQPSRQAQLVAAIQRMGRAPIEDAPPEVADESKGQPFTVNGEMAKLATAAPMRAQAAKPAAAADPQVDEQALRDDMWNAQEADRKSHLTAGMELAGRQLVGGITRTEVGQGIGAAPSRVPLAEEQARERRKAVADAIARKRQATMDASTLDLHASEAEKNRRLPADKAAQPTSNRTEEDRLRAEKLQLERDKFNAKNKPKSGGAAATEGPDALAQAIADGRAPPPTTRQKDYASVMSRVRKIRPDYDESTFGTYKHTRDNQATNPSINAAKAVTHHIGLLRGAVNNLPDGNDSPGVNSADQWLNSKLGTAKYTEMQTEADIVAAEMAQALGEKDVEGRAMVKHLVRHDQTKAEWATSLDTLEKLRDEKLGVYADTLKDLGPRNPSGTPDIPARDYVKTVNGFGYFYENGELHKEKVKGG